METGISVPVNATRDPLVYVPLTADVTTLRMLRKSDRTEVPMKVTQAPSKSEPQPWFLSFETREPDEYIVTGVDPCVQQKDLGSFTITPTVNRPASLGRITVERRPTESVTDALGVGGDCAPITATGTVTRTNLTLTVDPAVVPWRYVTRLDVEVDGARAGTDTDPTPALRDGSGVLQVSLRTRCGGEPAFMKNWSSLGVGAHTIRMVATVDANAVSPSEITTNEVPITVVCDELTGGGAAVAADDTPPVTASGCSVATSAGGRRSLLLGLGAVAATLAALRRRARR